MQISSSRDQFNSLAERYSQSPVHRAGPSLPVLLDLAAPTTSDVVLDVATGPGNTAFALVDSVQSVIAIDRMTGYMHAMYFLCVEQPALTIAVFAIMSAIAGAIGNRLPIRMLAGILVIFIAAGLITYSRRPSVEIGG